MGAGAYFVTLCPYKRRLLFGAVQGKSAMLGTLGEIAQQEWLRTGRIRDEVQLDKFAIMPNHLHAILFFLPTRMAGGHEQVGGPYDSGVGAHGHAPLERPARSLGSMVAQHKGAVTRRARVLNGDPDFRVWQRNDYDRVLRDEAELNALRPFSRQNPLGWELDRYHAD